MAQPAPAHHSQLHSFNTFPRSQQSTPSNSLPSARLDAAVRPSKLDFPPIGPASWKPPIADFPLVSPHGLHAMNGSYFGSGRGRDLDHDNSPFLETALRSRGQVTDNSSLAHGYNRDLQLWGATSSRYNNGANATSQDTFSRGQARSPAYPSQPSPQGSTKPASDGLDKFTRWNATHANAQKTSQSASTPFDSSFFTRPIATSPSNGSGPSKNMRTGTQNEPFPGLRMDSHSAASIGLPQSRSLRSPESERSQRAENYLAWPSNTGQTLQSPSNHFLNSQSHNANSTLGSNAFASLNTAYSGLSLRNGSQRPFSSNTANSPHDFRQPAASNHDLYTPPQNTRSTWRSPPRQPRNHTLQTTQLPYHQSFSYHGGSDPYSPLPVVCQPDMAALAAQMSMLGQCSPQSQPPLPPGNADLQPAHELRSACLADFKATAKTKKWELKDIYGYVVEFAGDHAGSLFIQSRLEKTKAEEKERIFHEIQPNALPLMKDVFGNYVLQKFFEHGDNTQKKWLISQMRGQIPDLAKHVYGCRVVQNALNHILVEQQCAVVEELQNCVMECVKNENGNHVVQVAIKVVPMQYLQTMIDQLYNNVRFMATHRYGCRVIQRLLEHCNPPALARILQEIHECSVELISDQFGNYVPQHVVTHGDMANRNRIIAIVQQNLISYAKQKYASNVVEKCVKYGTDEQKRQFMQQFIQHDQIENGELLPFLIRDSFGNYVIQSLLEHLNDNDYAEFMRFLEPAMNRARRPSPNKQSENVAKKMQRMRAPRMGWNCGPASGPQFGNYSTMRNYPPQINTQVEPSRSVPSATPPLTVAGTESPLSNAFPSAVDMSRQDSRQESQDWREDATVTIDSCGDQRRLKI